MKRVYAFVCISLLAVSCKKPFTPALNQSGNSRYLVVEGVITGSDSTIIKLSRTKLIDTSRAVVSETNAIVTIESDANSSIPLTEIKPGTYATPPFNLDAAHNY